MAVDWVLRGCPGLLEAPGNTREGFGGAKQWVRVSGVADLFSPHGVLLVGECERGEGNSVHVIQRRRVAGVDMAVDGEVDVTQAEGL